jgi:predicted Zn finger-like uncharacterized protein
VPNVISCPQCSTQLRVPDTIVPGSQVKCPTCAATFAATNASAPAPPPAQGQFSATPPPATAAAPPPNQPFPSRPLRQEPVYQDTAHRPGGKGAVLTGIAFDYTFSFGDYFRDGMSHYGAVFGPMLGFGFIIWGMYVIGNLPYIGSCISFVLYFFIMFAMYAGFVPVCLRQMRRHEWTFGDLFGGWSYWVPLFVINLLKIVVFLACCVPGIAALILWVVLLFNQASAPTTTFQTVGPGGSTVQTTSITPGLDFFTWYIASYALLFAGMVPCLCFYVRLFLFTPWFVIDRNCGPIEAIKENWNLTRGHFLGWFGMTSLLWALHVIAWAPCCLGVPFVLPIYYLVLNAAWMRITQAQVTEGPL